MRFFRSRIFWGLVALVIAGGLAFVGLPYVNGQTRETKLVVRVKERIPVETEITEDMLTIIEIGAYNCPDDAFTSIKSVAGLYAAVDLLPTDNLVPSKFTASLERKNESFYSLPETGMVAISVPLSSLAASVSGKILPDDIVTVYAVVKSDLTSENEVMQYSELLYMRVAAVTNSVAVDTMEVDLTNTTTSKADVVPATVTLYATDFQARRLIEIQSAGSVYIALVGRGQEAYELYEGFEPVNPYTWVAIQDGTPTPLPDAEPVPSPSPSVTD
jgi:Flp pilus assembly protein CpaB